MKRQHQARDGGPKAYWTTMRLLTRREGGFSVRDVAGRYADRSENTIACYVNACARGGYLDEVGERPSSVPNQPFKLYAVKVTAPDAAPFEKPDRVGLLGVVHQQLWTAMRGLPQFTTRDLAACASTDEIAVSSTTARVFCWKLEEAGYLQTLGKSGRWKVLRIKPGMSTGPDAPSFTSSGEVIDRNPRARRRAS